MSKIFDLINELCPKGVEFRELGEVGYFYGGLNGKTKDDFVKHGNVKYITYMNVFSNLSIDLNALEFVKIENNERQNLVAYGDVLFTGSSETRNECGFSSVLTKKPEEPIYLNSFCFGFRLNDLSLFEPEFLKYIFRSKFLRAQIIKTANGVTRFNISKTKFQKIKLPVPPLEVQREIVRILDCFTLLTAELTAELTARKKQYEFYRDHLLNFDKIQEKIEWMTIENIFIMKNGYTPSKANKDFWENGTIPWFRMEDIRENGRVLSDSIQKITPQAVKGGKLIPKNSIIVATTATIGEHALAIADSFLMNQRFTSFTIRELLKDKLDAKFVFYYFFKICEWCKQNTNSSSFPSVDMAKLKNVKFPIPPKLIQRKIVEILDKFDTLVSSISDGLPREIELRRKQYEYYRDLLLNFKEKLA